MNMTEWIDKKYDVVMYKIDDFFQSEIAKKRLQSIFTYPIFCKILASGNSSDDVHTREFNDPYDVIHCLYKFQDVVAYINMQVVFIPSIENFCMFMGWTASIYKQMLHDSSTEIQSVMQMVDDYIIESQMAAGQNGFGRASLTKFRSQLAGDHGNNFVTQKEENDNNKKKNELKTPEELQEELEQMGYKMLKNSW